MTDQNNGTVLLDLQSAADRREVDIERVGITDLRYPITILDRAQLIQSTIAAVTLSVDLPAHQRGTHMSRFVAALAEHRGELTQRTLPAFLAGVRDRLEARRAAMTLQFPYFLQRAAPASGHAALLDYDCGFRAESTADGDDFLLSVSVPVTSLCPCSKAISDYGAHNQRGLIDIEVRPVRTGASFSFVWLEELIELAEGAGSCPLFPLLKREDERHVTMHAYENPVFVEDMVREATVSLRTDSRIAWFSVRAVNHESIHNHSAFAEVQSGPRPIAE